VSRECKLRHATFLTEFATLILKTSVLVRHSVLKISFMLHVFFNLAELTVQDTADRSKSQNQRKRLIVKRKLGETGGRNTEENT